MVDIYHGDLSEDCQEFARALSAKLWAATPTPKDTKAVVPMAWDLAREMFPEMDFSEHVEILEAVLLRLNRGMRAYRLSRN